MGKWILIGVVVIASSAVGLRALQKHGEQQERDEQARRAAQIHVDLADMPDPEPASKPVEEAAVKKRVSKKPVIVNLQLKSKKGKKIRPFIGDYRVVNATGQTVSDGTTDGSGEPAVMILSPGTYDVFVPSKKRFKYKLDLLAVETERHDVTVIVSD